MASLPDLSAPSLISVLPPFFLFASTSALSYNGSFVPGRVIQDCLRWMLFSPPKESLDECHCACEEDSLRAPDGVAGHRCGADHDSGVVYRLYHAARCDRSSCHADRSLHDGDQCSVCRHHAGAVFESCDTDDRHVCDGVGGHLCVGADHQCVCTHVFGGRQYEPGSQSDRLFGHLGVGRRDLQPGTCPEPSRITGLRLYLVPPVPGTAGADEIAA